MPKAQLKNFKMSYYDNGNSDIPLILIHGFPLDKRMWELQIEKLLWSTRIITPDLRGHGESEIGSRQYSIESYADEIVEFISIMGIKKFSLGGFSMGGYIAMDLVKRYPEKVSSLLLLHTKYESDSDEVKIGREDMAKLAETSGANPIAERLIPRLLTQNSVDNRPDLVDRVHRMITQCSIEGIAGDLRAMAAREDFTNTLKDLNIPTLIVSGKNDVVIPSSESEKMHNLINNSQLHILQETSHLSNLEKSDEFNTIISKFINQ
jgi:pimeloyl-ACP methyl ester carboxylesterase